MLKDLIVNSKIIKTKDYNEDPILQEFDNIPDPTKPQLEDYSLLLELDNTLLEYTQISMFDIIDKIGKQASLDDGIFIQMNDDNSDNPVLKVSLPRDESLPLKEYEVIELLKRSEIELLNKIHLQGISGIEKVFISEKNQDRWDPKQGFISEKIKFIETEGTNLLDVFSIPEVDAKRTISNNIVEIYNIFGIEAARKALLNELRMVLSFDGSYVNYRHLAILVDIMTYKGFMMSMTRHGINRVETGTLIKCSFEETVEILTEAASYGQKDVIKGVSENIMLGQLGPFGTGTFDVLLDEKSVDKYTELVKHLYEIQQITTVDGRGHERGVGVSSKVPINHDENIQSFIDEIQIRSKKKQRSSFEISKPIYSMENEFDISEPVYSF